MATVLFILGTAYSTLGFVLCFEVQSSDQLEMGVELLDHCGSSWGRYLGLRII